MALIHRCQQANNLPAGTFMQSRPSGTLLALDLVRLAVLGNRPGDLLAGITVDLHQLADNDTFIPFAQPLIAKFNQDPRNPAVTH